MTAPPDGTGPPADKAAADRAEHAYELTLFVNGASALSARAIDNARRLCDTHLTGHYRLSVIDVHDDLPAVIKNGVVAAPTLVRNRPLPVRRLVGDLSHTDRVLRALGVVSSKDEVQGSRVPSQLPMAPPVGR